MQGKKPPSYWREGSIVMWPPQSGNEAARSWSHSLTDLKILRSLSVMKDGTTFIHISVSKKDRLPSWEELSKIKEEFLGDDVIAYHVMPPKKDYVNVHSFCLHIWHPIDKSAEVANLQNIVREAAY